MHTRRCREGGCFRKRSLSDVDEENGHATTKERMAASAAARKGKIKHAVLDCLRMLGVVVVHDEDLKDIAVAGLSMVGSRPLGEGCPRGGPCDSIGITGRAMEDRSRGVGQGC